MHRCSVECSREAGWHGGIAAAAEPDGKPKISYGFLHLNVHRNDVDANSIKIDFHRITAKIRHVRVDRADEGVTTDWSECHLKMSEEEGSKEKEPLEELIVEHALDPLASTLEYRLVWLKCAALAHHRLFSKRPLA